MEKFCVHRIDWHISDARDAFMLLFLIPITLWLYGTNIQSHTVCLVLYIQIMWVRYIVVKAFRYWLSNELDYADKRMCTLVGSLLWLSNGGLVHVSKVYPDLAIIPIMLTTIYLIAGIIDICIIRDMLRNNVAKRLTQNTQAVMTNIYAASKHRH